ncbi:MAG: ribonucleoside triphosphate reductase, partial [Candidatus Magasanikbacteria bacterium]|nr:ribonucleoside triphosphate reductase [Candidatus Magasanikbacteria bacterium]
MPLHKIQKRNGAIVDFDIEKIEKAIHSTLKAVGTDDNEKACAIAKDVCVAAEDLYNDKIPTVEQVQDIVESVLIKHEYVEAAKAYILYRAKRGEAREQRNVVIEVGKTVSEYLDKLDWRVNANSNQGYSLGGMILNTSGKVTANYWLSHILPQAVGDTHRNGDFHVHDLDMFCGYCAG